ncbi:DUF6786 family protein [uncultured Algibacter sp.]|uniref:DUF6786 family protein n=1 Tax=uncultured Algibacter sp. TaxID=298659 RepID=UPI00262D93B4|nr:DUF6786 family protein [uncultured Algibacter sp.]
MKLRYKISTIVTLFIFLFNDLYAQISNYETDFELFASKTRIIELVSSDGKGRIAIAPEIQGKIIGSSYHGLKGKNNGWINKFAFNNGSINFEAIGGEDRIWLGPLGGQHSFYFQQLKPLRETNWMVPPQLSSDAFTLKSSSSRSVVLEKGMELTNFIGTCFRLNIERRIKILERHTIENNLNISLDKNLNYVAYESAHTLTNTGLKKWKKETGLIALWSAGMFEGSDESVVIIPLEKPASLEDIYKYMGPLDSERLSIKKQVVLFKADGKYRSKIGIPNTLAPTIYGCYSKNKKQLTIVQYRKTNDSLFFNSNVSIQKEPYQGEVIPIYNNGTMDYSKTNKTSFFELESTSPFKELAPNENLEHFHRVYHFSGTASALEDIALKLLKISLRDCSLGIIKK